jgi:NADH pyrophosphatase NudC (nudix superfamily)
MTLMSPKPKRVNWQKNTRFCKKCGTEFVIDGRGKPTTTEKIDYGVFGQTLNLGEG